ncbi:MAG: PsbP-related protein [Vicingaceae bacterium]|nr:PsbP-related protein [Vicingaceae bacterium]
MKATQLLVLLAIALSFSAYGQTKDNWKSFNKDNYAIKYPGDWELNQSGKLGTSFILFSPLSDEQDQFKENVNLLIQDLTGHNLNLDQYTEVSVNQIKTVLTGAELIESKRIDNYHNVIYTAKQGSFDLKFEQYYWVKNNKAYVLTLTCEENQFDAFKMVGEKMLNSFLIR